MTLGIGRLEMAIINVIHSLPIHSSVLFALIAGLFLAALIIRAQRLPSRPSETSRRRASMSATTSRGGASAASTTGAPAAQPASRFTVHWGRTSVVLLGLLALLTATVTGVLAAATSLTVTVPLISGAVFLASLATLRTMAASRRRRRRRRRLDAALREAMNPDVDEAGLRRPTVPSTAAAVTEHSARTGPFDALSSDERGVGGPRSLQEVDADGLPVDLAETFPAGEQPAPAAASPAEPWEPRELPKPKYLEVEKAERPLPEPITPEAPKPSADVKIGRAASGPAVAPPTPARPQTAVQQSLDLDAVLKRRRA
ncbi:hypothetical protein [Nesterenkonia sp. HG001]|uniref:hypothetical protein n=1 Tax=Nesterenkonia sp. HG001 TaxID=2983207 RepID=UPI002AC3AA55|nr:hypothetical protein [Nesterenkonia sp. HG001]MDZ5078729.1 hypothetical protein [Nesterenkonia sp. HG001]